MNNYPNPILVFYMVTSSGSQYIIADPTASIESFYNYTLLGAFNSMVKNPDIYNKRLRNVNAREFHSVLYKGTHYNLEQVKDLFPELFI